MRVIASKMCPQCAREYVFVFMVPFVLATIGLSLFVIYYFNTLSNPLKAVLTLIGAFGYPFLTLFALIAICEFILPKAREKRFAKCVEALASSAGARSCAKVGILRTDGRLIKFEEDIPVPASEVGLYHFEGGVLRSPACKVDCSGADTAIISVLDPNKACSLEGYIEVYRGNHDFAKARLVPVAPGVVRAEVECNLTHAVFAKLYIGPLLAIKCTRSGKYIADVDLRGIKEPVVVVADFMSDAEEVIKLFETPIAGLCSGAKMRLVIGYRGGYSVEKTIPAAPRAFGASGATYVPKSLY